MSCSVRNVSDTDFCAYGGLMTVKLPKDNSVGYDVIVDLAKFPNNNCPEG
jgi:hypothetical protein